MKTANQQDMVVISTAELKALIKTSIREELANFPQYEEVSDKEQKEIEQLFGEHPVLDNSSETIFI